MTMTEPRLFPVRQTVSTSDDAFTPPWVFDRLGLQFDLDVCSPVDGVPWIPAVDRYTQEQDGLLCEWYGCVWMNPPWSTPREWIRRFIAHGHGVCLVPCSSGEWFHDLWMSADACLLPTPKTMTFHRSNLVAYPGGLPIRVAMFAYGDECVEALRNIGPIRKLA